MSDLDQSGIYKWWVDKVKLQKILEKMGAWNLIDIEKEIQEKDIENKEMYCIYVGQGVNLRDRLKNHMGGNINKSTLRKSLGAILWEGEDLETLKKNVNVFINDFYVECKFVIKDDLDLAESEEISQCLRILNIDGYNHKSFMRYINKPLSVLRKKIKECK
jgi:hypothetical protein